MVCPSRRTLAVTSEQNSNVSALVPMPAEVGSSLGTSRGPFPVSWSIATHGPTRISNTRAISFMARSLDRNDRDRWCWYSFTGRDGPQHIPWGSLSRAAASHRDVYPPGCWPGQPSRKSGNRTPALQQSASRLLRQRTKWGEAPGPQGGPRIHGPLRPGASPHLGRLGTLTKQLPDCRGYR